MKTKTTTKKIGTTALALCCLMLTAGAAWSADYSRMSNDELSQVRGTLSNATQTEWDAFHTEWWKRLSQMSSAERSQYLGPRAQAPGLRGGGKGMGRGAGMAQGQRGYGMGRGYCAPCPPANPAPAGR